MNPIENLSIYNPIPIDSRVYNSLIRDAAIRIVSYEIEHDTLIGKSSGDTSITNEIIFPGGSQGMSNKAKHFFRQEVSKMIKQSTGNRIHPSNFDRLTGLGVLYN